jgi:hypothetical protein
MKTTFLTAVLLMSFGVACFGESVDGYLMPSKCQADEPVTHTKQCALRCKSTGFGVVTAGGEFVGFDAAGNAKAIAMLQSTAKADDLRVSVEGTREAGLLNVQSIAWKVSKP